MIIIYRNIPYYYIPAYIIYIHTTERRDVKALVVTSRNTTYLHLHQYKIYLLNPPTVLFLQFQKLSKEK